MNDWNPDDPDAESVHYDLSEWTLDQRAELAAALADAEIAHGWSGTELLVPVEVEQAVDAITDELEVQLGITYGEAAAPAALDDEGPLTEYDLDEWDPSQHAVLTRALVDAGIPHRWEGTVVLVPTTDEAVVEALLDDIESGEHIDLGADGDVDGDGEVTDLDAEVLTTFFLAGEKLRRKPLDADGLEQLRAASEVADPSRPPFGVQPRLWEQTCLLADRVVDALVDDDGPDHEAAAAAAGELHDLLRPYI